MRTLRLDRSILFLVAILAVLLVAAAMLVFAMKTDPVRDSLSGDKLLKVLVVLEELVLLVLVLLEVVETQV